MSGVDDRRVAWKEFLDRMKEVEENGQYVPFAVVFATCKNTPKGLAINQDELAIAPASMDVPLERWARMLEDAADRLRETGKLMDGGNLNRN